MNPTAPSPRARPRYVAIASAENALVFASDIGARRDAGGGASLVRAHAALDAVDAKIRAFGATTPSRYLGECHRAHDGACFGYASCARTRMILEYGEDVSERTVREDFDRLAEAYAEAACDAFGEVGERMEGNAAFRRAVAALGERTVG